MWLSSIIYLSSAPLQTKFASPWHRAFLALCLVTQSCPALFYPMDCSPPGSSVHGVLQTRILEWVAISFSRRYSQLTGQNCIFWVSCVAGGIFPAKPSGKPNTPVSCCILLLGVVALSTAPLGEENLCLDLSWTLVLCASSCF